MRAALLVSMFCAACGGEPDRPRRYEHKETPGSDGAGPVTGRLDPGTIRQVMQQQAAGFNNCFRRNAGSFVSGVARLRFVVGGSGRVEQVWVARADLGSWAIEDCLVQSARFLEFPPPDGGRARFDFPYRWNEVGDRLAQRVDEGWGYRALVKHRPEIERCRKLHGFDAPFQITAYIGRKGQALSVGMHAETRPADEFVACAVHAVERISFPDPGHRVVKYKALVEDLRDVP